MVLRLYPAKDCWGEVEKEMRNPSFLKEYWETDSKKQKNHLIKSTEQVGVFYYIKEEDQQRLLK